MRMGRNDTANNKRAEEVRKRRTERTQQRVNTVSNRVTNPVNVRPVIVRGSDFGTPIHRQAGTRARRQFYVTMDQAAGAELRLPAIPLVNPGWRLLSAMILILAALGIYSLWNSPFFRVYTVDVQGLQRVSAQEITDRLALNDVSIVEVDPQFIQETLTREYPELSNITTTVEMPNIVTITTTERQPVLAWQQGEHVTWIDADGVAFPVRGDVGPLLTIHTEDDLPLGPVSAEIIVAEREISRNAQSASEEESALETETSLFQRRADPALLTAAQSLSEKLPPETTLVYDNENGLGWLDPMGWQVYIGRNLNDFEAKYNMYQSLASHLTEQGIQPRLVSVAQINAPFYRLEQ